MSRGRPGALRYQQYFSIAKQGLSCSQLSSHDAPTGMHTVVIGGSLTAYQSLSQTGNGINHQQITSSAHWIRGKYDTGCSGVHHGLHHNIHCGGVTASLVLQITAGTFI